MQIVRWPAPLPYTEGLARLEAAAAAVARGGSEQFILGEHTPVLTVGSSGQMAEAGMGHGVPVVATNRGGQVTYHGPGQLMIYPIVRLDARWNNDIRQYMRWLQERVQVACASLGVTAEVRTGAELGLWVAGAKLAAFGVRVRQGVAFHGACLNVSNDLEIYQHFTPCGLIGSKATRLIDHVPTLTIPAVEVAVIQALKL
jgi:lipoyl(octanoyl) transferase